MPGHADGGVFVQMCFVQVVLLALKVRATVLLCSWLDLGFNLCWFVALVAQGSSLHTRVFALGAEAEAEAEAEKET